MGLSKTNLLLGVYVNLQEIKTLLTTFAVEIEPILLELA